MKRSLATAVLTALILSLMATPALAHDIIFIERTQVFVTESSGEGGVVVRRAQHGTGPASVDAATVGGTATEGSDYAPSTKTLTLQPVDAAEFTFPVTNDAEIEGLETVNVELSNPTGGPSLATREATVTLIDDDGPTRLSFAEASTESYENYGFIEFVVIRSGDLAPAAGVGYSTADGSAVAGQDYTAASGTISFGAGERIKRFRVAVDNDRLQEGSEEFVVTLADPVGAELAEPISASGVIQDDETPSSDTSPPVSYFHQPLHKETYRARNIRDILAFADDYGTGVKKVEIALLTKMANGSCRWFSKQERSFERGPCATKRWMSFATSETVVYTLPSKLRSSIGTKIKYYKAWSRGTDEIGNVERSFDLYRNVSRFEVR